MHFSAPDFSVDIILNIKIKVGNKIMAFSVKAIKGTNDVLPCESHKYQYIEQAALDTAKSFGFL